MLVIWIYTLLFGFLPELTVATETDDVSVQHSFQTSLENNRALSGLLQHTETWMCTHISKYNSENLFIY